MSEVAAYWSNYEQVKIEIESNIRHKIYGLIQDAIRRKQIQITSRRVYCWFAVCSGAHFRCPISQVGQHASRRAFLDKIDLIP
jgi:hypothetical protein